MWDECSHGPHTQRHNQYSTKSPKAISEQYRSHLYKIWVAGCNKICHFSLTRTSLPRSHQLNGAGSTLNNNDSHFYLTVDLYWVQKTCAESCSHLHFNSYTPCIFSSKIKHCRRLWLQCEKCSLIQPTTYFNVLASTLNMFIKLSWFANHFLYE